MLLIWTVQKLYSRREDAVEHEVLVGVGDIGDELVQLAAWPI